MAHFDKNSNEYIDNGHYNISNKEFMSIWTFKKNNRLTPNDNKINGSEGLELLSKGVANHTTTPDFGNFDKIFIYPVEDLEMYFQNY